MDQIYQEALEGTLRSQANGNRGPYVFVNRTEVSLSVFAISGEGLRLGYDPGRGDFIPGPAGYPLSPGDELDMTEIEDGAAFVLINVYSGAFVAAFKKSPESAHEITVCCTDLLAPGEIGPLPEPSPVRLIPADSPRVLVACGPLPDGGLLTREQFWRLSGSSYTLAPSEDRTVTVTESSGMESTSSQQQELASSLGLSVSGGWGPVSASISATLSMSASRSQQVTLTENRTTLISTEVENGSDEHPATIFIWELVDVVTAFSDNGEPTAAVESVIQPSLVSGPHNALDPDGPRPALRWRTAEAVE
jgi:hypothetical protein